MGGGLVVGDQYDDYVYRGLPSGERWTPGYDMAVPIYGRHRNIGSGCCHPSPDEDSYPTVEVEEPLKRHINLGREEQHASSDGNSIRDLAGNVAGYKESTDSTWNNRMRSLNSKSRLSSWGSPRRSVISIPVVQVNDPSDGLGVKLPVTSSEGLAKSKNVKMSMEEAVVLLQSKFRGVLVRRTQPLAHLRTTAKVRSQLTELKKRTSDVEFIKLARADSATRVKVTETLMNLLLQLDSVQGAHSVVREIRRSATKEVINLQEKIDGLLAGKTDRSTTLLPLVDLPDSAESPAQSVSEKANEVVEERGVEILNEVDGDRLDDVEAPGNDVEHQHASKTGALGDELEGEPLSQEKAASMLHSRAKMSVPSFQNSNVLTSATLVDAQKRQEVQLKDNDGTGSALLGKEEVKYSLLSPRQTSLNAENSMCGVEEIVEGQSEDGFDSENQKYLTGTTKSVDILQLPVERCFSTGDLNGVAEKNSCEVDRSISLSTERGEQIDRVGIARPSVNAPVPEKQLHVKDLVVQKMEPDVSNAHVVEMMNGGKTILQNPELPCDSAVELKSSGNGNGGDCRIATGSNHPQRKEQKQLDEKESCSQDDSGCEGKADERYQTTSLDKFSKSNDVAVENIASNIIADFQCPTPSNATAFVLTNSLPSNAQQDVQSSLKDNVPDSALGDSFRENMVESYNPATAVTVFSRCQGCEAVVEDNLQEPEDFLNNQDVHEISDNFDNRDLLIKLAEENEVVKSMLTEITNSFQFQSVAMLDMKNRLDKIEGELLLQRRKIVRPIRLVENSKLKWPPAFMQNVNHRLDKLERHISRRKSKKTDKHRQRQMNERSRTKWPTTSSRSKQTSIIIEN